MIKFTAKEDSIIFSVRVVPRASKSEIVGELNGALKIRLIAAPVGGAANAELVKLLSKTFEVSKSAVEIIGGHASKSKQVKISGAGKKQILQIRGF
ncbi:MAG: DUF167 domain-containing protein [Pyrinomonadaceae bacterium]